MTGPRDVDRVLFIALSGAVVPLRIVGPAGQRWRTRGLDGVERAIGEDRVLWPSEQRAASDEALAAYWEGVRARADDLDLPLAWSVLRDGGDLNPLTGRALAGLAAGDAGSEAIDAVSLAAFEDGLYFKLKRGHLIPASESGLESARREREDENRRRRGLALATAHLSARLRHKPPPDGDDPDEVAATVGWFIDRLIGVALYGEEAPDAAEALSLLEGLGRTRGEAPHRAFGLLVALGEMDLHENLALRRAGIRRDFPPEVLAEAEGLAPGVATGTVADYRHLPTVAIDDARTTEVDDAFAVDGDLLRVFIADAARFAPPGSLVEGEAARRVATLYVPEGKIPMLPGSVGEGAASLEAGEDRYALCFSARLGADGWLADLSIEEALCRVDRRLTYDEVDVLLEGEGEGDGADPGEWIRRVAGWMGRHRDARVASGALQLTRREVQILVGDDAAVVLEATNPMGRRASSSRR